MVPSLTPELMKEKISNKYRGQEAVVGIMLGRYTVKRIQMAIDESYKYWHINSGKGFDIYWGGYGEYWGNPSSKVLKFEGNDNGVYYDEESFVSFKEYLKENGIKYRDKFLFILCNVRNGKVYIKEHLEFDLEKIAGADTGVVRDMLEMVIDLSKSHTDVQSIKCKIDMENFWNTVKGITLSDVFNVAVNGLGAASSVVSLT